MKKVLCPSPVILSVLGASCGKSVSYNNSMGNIAPTTTREISSLCSARHLKQQDFASMMYQSCEEVDSDLNELSLYNSCVSEQTEKMHDRIRRQPERLVVMGSPASADASAASEADVLTNLRESGVDEADFVKVSDSQIFVASSNSVIQVIERATKKLTGKLKLNDTPSQALPGGQRTRNIGVYIPATKRPEMFVTSNRLVVLHGNQISVYQTSAGAIPSLLQSRSWHSEIKEVRLVGDRLVIASTRWVNLEASDRATANDLSCTSIVRPRQKIELGTRAMTRVSSLSLNNLSDVFEVNHVGERKIYMTPKNVYLYSSPSYGEKSALLSKMSIGADGQLSFPVEGIAKGRIKDVWALSELPTGELAVASTTGQLHDNSARNHFEVFRETGPRLLKVGETGDYGIKEDIRSVRFVGNIAYVVTFKNTDPLYAIDVSKPSAPRILGELKIPGFSTYMHPLSSERLIGLGFDATDYGRFASIQGLQLSLFDTSDPMKMERKDVKILGTRGTSSAATTDHRAFYMDQAEGVIGFPISEIATCRYDSACPPRVSALQLSPVIANDFSGAVLYRVSEDSLGQDMRVSHTDLMSSSCRARSVPMTQWWESSGRTPDIQRIFKVAGEIFTVSQGALKSFRLGSALESTGSASWDSDCD